MSFLKKPFFLGKCLLPSNIFCAPLAGCSDLPFRRMTSRFEPGLIYCEMVKMEALIRNDPHTFQLLEYEDGMHPIGGQLCGSNPSIAGQCAKIIEDLGFDVVDLNCGCPVDKVTKDGSGSGLLKNPQLIGEILANMIAAVKIPVTVKIRTGWDEKSINCEEITQIAEKAGAKAICIHGRTREQGYKGPANWDTIKSCKAAAKDIIVIGNGDIVDARSALRMFEHTGCDAVLLSRGTFGQPWIIEDIYRLLEGKDPQFRSGIDCRDSLLEHFRHVYSYRTERKAILEMRRIGCWYLKKGVGVKNLREALNRAKSTEEIGKLLMSYPWHEMKLIESNEMEDACEC
jgi:tRNA-dihydrouridine synthase B